MCLRISPIYIHDSRQPMDLTLVHFLSASLRKMLHFCLPKANTFRISQFLEPDFNHRIASAEPFALASIEASRPSFVGLRLWIWENLLLCIRFEPSDSCLCFVSLLMSEPQTPGSAGNGEGES